ncbi:MAG: N-formylglutamate amidohydrolase [Roseiarcus sp.]|jgi:predicted N-formylglutamate amidohydrolase
MTRTEAVGVAEFAVAIERANGPSPVVLVCDHASNDVPARYRALGLSAADLEEHFAWDPGALAVGRRLSEMLDAPLVYGRVSRLVIDVNRDPADPDSIVAVGERTSVPGNQNLSPSERRQRVADVYEPYHAALEMVLRDRASRGRASVLIGVHSFTPSLHGASRPWHCGILFADNRQVADALVGALRREDGLNVGVNEPYAPSDRVYHTLSRHGDSNGLATAMIEIRNDLVVGADEQNAWARRLARALEAAIQGTVP